MKIIMLASIDPSVNSEDVNKYCISPAANNFIVNLARGIYNNGTDIEILSMQPLLKNFVGYRNKRVFNFNNIKITMVRYLQFGTIFRVIYQIVSCFLELLKIIKYKKCNCIVSYNVNIEWFLPAYLICKIYKIKNVVIVADYTPKYNNIKKNIKCYIETLLLKKSDKIITLSSNIINKINYKNKYIVMEGGVECHKNILTNKTNDKIVVMYSGELSLINGVDIIIEAASKINKKIEFWVSGKGELEEKIKNNTNIKYLGFLSREEYKKHVSIADIMVSARRSIYKENYYNFPSKILEYLSFGKIVVSTKLNTLKSISDYIYFFDENADDLIKIIYILSMNLEFYKKKCIYNKKILYKNYNWNYQAKKIIHFIESR